MKNIFLFLSMLASVFLFAQNNYEDVVYLKNGGIMHGIIIEQVPNVSLKIQTWDGNVFAYKLTEIEKITKEPTKQQRFNAEPTTQTGRAKDSFSFNKTVKHGVLVETQIGGLFAIGYSTKPPNYFNGQISFFQWKTAFLAHLSPRLFLGGGAAIEAAPSNAIIYNQGNHDIMIPLFAEVKGCFLKKRFSPFISQDVGYAFYVIAPQSDLITHTVIGGAMLQTQVGVKFFATPKVALNMSAGYRFQQLYVPSATNETYYYYYGQTNYNIFSHYLTLSWGVTF